MAIQMKKASSMQIVNTIPGSFRDPDGFLFVYEGNIYRQINLSYAEVFNRIEKSGLYEYLWDNRMLISHKLVDKIIGQPENAFAVIKPQKMPFISYPYEWCFDQLKDASLLTLQIQSKAMNRGFSLKDASAFNVQFINGNPIFIDTLSFEILDPKSPWVAYNQFCKHFFAPLALMAFVDVRLVALLQVYIDGIPLDLASRLLPLKTFFRPSTLFHIHLHAKIQAKYADKKKNKNKKNISPHSVPILIDSLKSSIKRMRWKKENSEWGDYYDNTNYSDETFESKKSIVTRMLRKCSPSTVWDMGANTGIFSRLALKYGAHVVAFDIDFIAVNNNYKKAKKKRETLLPLLLDLTNPSPSIGWNCEERSSVIARGPVDVCMALALIHHLAISNNLPLSNVAKFFASICKYLIIEFVPKEDSQVKRLLASRKDIFEKYDLANFIDEFKGYFHVIEKISLINSDRSLFLMKSKILNP